MTTMHGQILPRAPFADRSRFRPSGGLFIGLALSLTMWALIVIVVRSIT